MEREKIVALIVEDMKHNQLLNGLHTLGLDDNDRYILKIDLLVAELMGFVRGTVPDVFFDTYHATMQNVTSEYSSKELEQQAIILYTTLQEIEH